jgi:hypothetical protein
MRTFGAVVLLGALLTFGTRAKIVLALLLARDRAGPAIFGATFGAIEQTGEAIARTVAEAARGIGGRGVGAEEAVEC